MPASGINLWVPYQTLLICAKLSPGGYAVWNSQSHRQSQHASGCVQALQQESWQFQQRCGSTSSKVWPQQALMKVCKHNINTQRAPQTNVWALQPSMCNHLVITTVTNKFIDGSFSRQSIHSRMESDKQGAYIITYQLTIFEQERLGWGSM